MELPWTVPAVYVAATLAVAGALDVRTREIPPLYWYFSCKVGALMGALALYLGPGTLGALLYLAASLLALASALMLYRLCMMGGADVGAVALIALALPYHPASVLPPVVASILYALAPSLAYAAYSSYRACGASARCIARSRHMIPAGWIVKNPGFYWWFPAGEGCSLDVEPQEEAARLSGGDMEGLVEASPGHPYVAFIGLGYLAYLVLGDKPLIALLEVVGA